MIFDLEEILNINSDCDNFYNLPDIKIQLNSRKSYLDKETEENYIILKPEDYLIEGRRIKRNLDKSKKEDDLQKELDNIFNTGHEECQPAFMPIDVPAPRGPIFVFGEYFLRKFYTVFDRDHSLLGFSLANHGEDVSLIENIKTPYDNKQNEINKKENKFISKEISMPQTFEENIKNSENISGDGFLQTENEASMLDDEFTKSIGLNQDSNSPSDSLDLDLDFLINPEKSNNEKDNMQINDNSNQNII